MKGINFNFQDLNMPKAFWIMIGTAVIILSLAAAIALVWYGQVIFIFKSHPVEGSGDKERIHALALDDDDDDADLVEKHPLLEDK